MASSLSNLVNNRSEGNPKIKCKFGHNDKICETCGIKYKYFYRHARANNKYMKDFDKNKESTYLQYWDANNFYGLVMSQMLPVNNLSRQKILLILMKIS